MNNDLISRSALKKALEEERQFLLARGQTGAEHILVHNFRDLIDNAPTVAANKIEHKSYNEGFKDGVDQGIKLSERPHGEWVPIAPDCRGYTEVFECSHCGEHIYRHYCMKENDYPNCPFCTADMRGEENE